MGFGAGRAVLARCWRVVSRAHDSSPPMILPSLRVPFLCSYRQLQPSLITVLDEFSMNLPQDRPRKDRCQATGNGFQALAKRYDAYPGRTVVVGGAERLLRWIPACPRVTEGEASSSLPSITTRG